MEARFQGVSQYFPRLAVVESAERMADDIHLLRVCLADGGSLGHKPGEFVQVSLFGFGEAPISVCSPAEDTSGFELCVHCVGNVTRAMGNLAPGDHIGIRGPYGRGFPLDQMAHHHLLLIGAGLGIAPLRPVVHYFGYRPYRYRTLSVLQGARRPELLLFKHETESLMARGFRSIAEFIVDEPNERWHGPQGVITELVAKQVLYGERTWAAVVGPPVVFRFVALALLKKGLPKEQILFSLERNFHCGIGKCGHCQLDGMYVCQDGPVFSYAQLEGCAEALEIAAPE